MVVDRTTLMTWLFDRTGLLTGRLTWRVNPTRLQKPGEEGAWRAYGALVRVGSLDVGACGHAGRRFFAGFSTVDSSGCPLHDGMFKNTFGEL